MTEIIGYIAAACTSISFVPQAVLVWRSNNTDGISLYMFVIFCFGLLAWLWYGYLLNEMPIILCNAFTLILAGYILYKKIQHTQQLSITKGLQK
jgi:MtN3 and saliva related transmembrane protein